MTTLPVQNHPQPATGDRYTVELRSNASAPDGVDFWIIDSATRAPWATAPHGFTYFAMANDIVRRLNTGECDEQGNCRHPRTFVNFPPPHIELKVGAVLEVVCADCLDAIGTEAWGTRPS